jgi:6-phosphofructokinase 1
MCADAARSDLPSPASERLEGARFESVPGGPVRVEDVAIKDLGRCRFPSRAAAHLGEGAMLFVGEADKVLIDDRLSRLPSSPEIVRQLPAFELAGPRNRVFFDATRARAGIVTCGGLCPGLNNVIRGLDSVYCWNMAWNAVHAAMAGNTEMLIGRWHGRFVHVPMPLATRSRKQVDPGDDVWTSVIEATGQPRQFL